MKTPTLNAKLLNISALALLSTISLQTSLSAEETVLTKRVAAPSLQVAPPMPNIRPTTPKIGESISQPNIEVVFVLDTTGSMSGLG